VDGAGTMEINGPIRGVGGGASAPPVPFAGPFTFNQVGSPNFNLEGWTVTSGSAGAHDLGAGNFALTAGRFAGDYAWDFAHTNCIISSPRFVLDGSGNPLTFVLIGGDSNGRALPTHISQINPLAISSNATGVQGVGLRRVDTGDYVLTKAAPNDNFNGTLSFSALELASLDPDAVYVFDFFDTYDGGWGWVDVDNVSIPGNEVVSIPVDNRLIKRGTGTLRLNGANTYDGGTTVESGLLLANHATNSTGPELVSVGDGAVLGGTGRIAGQIVVNARGVVAPGASTGILATGTNVVFNSFASVFRAELNGAAAAGTNYDQLQVAQVLDLGGATLQLVRDPGYIPIVGQVLTIATAAGGVTGTFNDLPEGSRVSAQGREFVVSYAGGAVTLTASGGLHVYAGPDTVYRVPTSGVTMAATTLLANDLMGDGAGPLQITSVLGASQAGGVISLATGQITYTPPLNYTGADSFTYTVSDGTDTTTGLVTLLPTTGTIGERPVSNPAGLMALPNGNYRVTFTGTPGVPYDIEWSLDIDAVPVVWQMLGTVVADGSGNITLDHANPPASLIYYRAVLR
jgi:autotransporter-associated beta strand protein